MSTMTNAQLMEAETITITIRDKYTVILSKCDQQKVQEQRWRLRGKYLISEKCSMHEFVMGPRPDNIPEDWVVDHANRDRMNNAQSNLRYVTRSFNSWNAPITGKSRFKGVFYDTKKKKWGATVAGKQFARFTTEREAAKAVAREAIRLWPLWAPTSDLLIGENLLSQDEIHAIQKSLQEEVFVPQTVRELPKGVTASRNGTYIAMYREKWIGTFKTVAEAEEAYNRKRQELHEAERKEHWEKEITRDHNGNAIIALTQGYVAIVDDNLWHILTYKQSWRFSKGYAYGRGSSMHQLVFQLLHPQHVPSKKLSIDHRNHEQKLDNRGSNLRLANASEQTYNQGRRRNTSSEYFGVHWDSGEQAWQVKVRKERKEYGKTRFVLETDAARHYNVIAKEHYGDFAKVNVIPADAISVGFDDQNKRIGLAAQRKRLQVIEEAQKLSVNPVSQAS